MGDEIKRKSMEEWLAECNDVLEEKKEMNPPITPSAVEVGGVPPPPVSDLITTINQWNEHVGPRWFRLDGHTPVPSTLEEMLELGSENYHQRVQEDYIGGVHISTVFMGLDHNWGGGPPILFETMIFGGAHNMYCDRCSTWEGAETMHCQAILMVENSQRG